MQHFTIQKKLENQRTSIQQQLDNQIMLLFDSMNDWRKELNLHTARIEAMTK